MKHLPNNDNQFYPTPQSLAFKCFDLLENEYHRDSFILDPSAGKGDFFKHLIAYYEQKYRLYDRIRLKNLNAIEIDSNLRKILTSEDIKVIGDDFLQFDSIETYDLILMNPPFKDGDKHLLRAINFVINGEIICILNAETIKNPYTNTRKELINRLAELNADIKYEENAFESEDTERHTDVEVAIIHIKLVQDFNSIFDENYEKTNLDIDLNDGTEVKNNKEKLSISELIYEYQDYQKRIADTCTAMFKASYGCRNFFNIAILDPFQKYPNEPKIYDMHNIENAIRDANAKLKKQYWRIVLDRPEFKSKLTTDEVRTFDNLINRFSDMEFSQNNINVLYEYLLENGNNLFKNAIYNLFDEITSKLSWYPETGKNIYLYNGWKSNNGYKINKKFILIFRNAYSGKCFSYDWETKTRLEDIEKVFTYFNNGITPEISLSQSYIDWFENRRPNNYFENSLFKVRVYQKGTLHFYVKDEALLRRFNVYVGRERTWLPPDYAMKTYNECNTEEKRVIDEFEGEKQYTSNLNDPLLTNLNKSLLMIEAA